MRFDTYRGLGAALAMLLVTAMTAQAAPDAPGRDTPGADSILRPCYGYETSLWDMLVCKPHVALYVVACRVIWDTFHEGTFVCPNDWS